MPNLIQARAKGFLDLLGAKTGMGPREQLDTLQPIVDLFRFYAANRYQIGSATTTGGVPAALGLNNASNSFRFLHVIGFRLTVPVGMTSAHARVAYTSPIASTNAIDLLDCDFSPPTVFTAATNHFRTLVFPEPLPWVPGGQVTCTVDDLQGAAAVTVRLSASFWQLNA